MKKLLPLSLMIFMCLAYQPIFSQCGNLIIAGVIDGGLSGGLPKGIQVCAIADVADLSIYGLGSANNGGGSDGEEFTFPAETTSAGDCFWVASESIQFTNFFGFSPCYVNSMANINGDDAIELFCNSNLSDLFGDQNTDGNGECWEYVDGWAKNNTSTPNGGTFSCADWTFSGVNALDGETTNAGAGTPFPAPEQTCPLLPPLPVNLAVFSAEAQQDVVTLSWTTASEEHNDYFSIEHSTDGINYTEIDYVEGAGSAYFENNYEYFHRNPAKGTNYYRLAQVDYNRSINYSSVEVVEITGGDLFTLYPTLTKGEVTLNMQEDLSGTISLDVFDMMGRRVITARVDAFDNTLDLSDLQNGHYLVRIQAAGQIQTSRLVKY